MYLQSNTLLVVVRVLLQSLFPIHWKKPNLQKLSKVSEDRRTSGRKVFCYINVPTMKCLLIVTALVVLLVALRENIYRGEGLQNSKFCRFMCIYSSLYPSQLGVTYSWTHVPSIGLTFCLEAYFSRRIVEEFWQPDGIPQHWTYY